MSQKIQPLSKLLGQELQKFKEQSEVLEQINRLFAELLPNRLQQTYQIARIKTEEILITTTSPEIRYALNQFSHDFIRKLQKFQKFKHIKRIAFKIDLELKQILQSSNKTLGGHLDKAKRPSAQAARTMHMLSQYIEDAALAAALQRLSKLAEN